MVIPGIVIGFILTVIMLGIPTSTGLMLLFMQKTGEVTGVLLEDRNQLEYLHTCAPENFFSE